MCWNVSERLVSCIVLNWRKGREGIYKIINGNIFNPLCVCVFDFPWTILLNSRKISASVNLSNVFWENMISCWGALSLPRLLMQYWRWGTSFSSCQSFVLFNFPFMSYWFYFSVQVERDLRGSICWHQPCAVCKDVSLVLNCFCMCPATHHASYSWGHSCSHAGAASQRNTEKCPCRPRWEAS